MAEQHSIDVAWKELVSGDYPDLCVAIGFTTESERLCFRQLLVNAVVATDIMDAENCARQMQQWTVTFKDDNGCKSNAHAAEVLANRRATIAFELLMQASDISHYMQHWDIYQKWNQRLFDETKMAYHAGRSDKDPSTCWYQDELWFFDKCVIPLAHKLQKCGILGVLGGESLANALQNRHEFECMGQGVIQQYTKEYEEKYRR